MKNSNLVNMGIGNFASGGVPYYTETEFTDNEFTIPPKYQNEEYSYHPLGKVLFVALLIFVLGMIFIPKLLF